MGTRIFKQSKYYYFNLKKIIEIRKDEMHYKNISFKYSSINIFMLWAAPIFSIIITIGAFILLEGQLEMTNLITGLVIFNLIRQPLRSLPYSITSIIDLLVSLKRIEVYII